MNKIKAYGITYTLPRVYLLHKTPLFVSEYGARTCYNSYDKSENNSIKELKEIMDLSKENNKKYLKEIQEKIKKAEEEIDMKGSELLWNLSHVYFHESTLEHTYLNLYLENISRGVLQELARHRIASYSAQSTRYTINDLINIYLVTKKFKLGANYFINKITDLDIFVIKDKEYNATEILGIWNKLEHQYIILGEKEFKKQSIAKKVMEEFENSKSVDEALKTLSKVNKRNVGDFIKHIITDNFSVDLMFSINLRSLKNFLNLRLNGAAYWQIQLLSYAIYEAIPENYLKLILKENQSNKYKDIKERIEKGIWE